MYPCYNFNPFRYGHVQNANPLLTSLSVDRHDDMLFCTQLMRPCRVFVRRTCVNRKKYTIKNIFTCSTRTAEARLVASSTGHS
jgi:hypothetical protein